MSLNIVESKAKNGTENPFQRGAEAGVMFASALVLSVGTSSRTARWSATVRRSYVEGQLSVFTARGRADCFSNGPYESSLCLPVSLPVKTCPSRS
jgi:hypothetical protein